MKIKRGDTIKILYGKDAGKQGVVSAARNGKIVVDGLNMYKKHVKGNGKEKKSEIIDIAKPMDISKVMLVCPNCGKPTRVGIKRESGKVERICKKCNKIIEIATKKEEVKKEEVKKEKKEVKKTVKSKTKSKTKKE